MALTDAFVTTCRTAITGSGNTPAIAELTAFRAALSDVGNGGRAARIAAWNATYAPDINGTSPALALRKAIRGVVQAQATGAQGPLDLESAIQTLTTEFVPVYPKPPSEDRRQAGIKTLLGLT